MWHQQFHQGETEHIEKLSKSEAVRQVFVEFCSNSTIHGIREIFTGRKRHWSERIWWIIAFGLSIWLCGSSIRNIFISWNATPVMMSFTEKAVQVSKIPFPTVTICPETKANASKLNLTSAYELIQGSWSQLTEIEMARIEALIHLCRFYAPNVRFSNWFTNESIYDLIQDMAPSFQHTLLYCMWQYKDDQCSTFFTEILTDEGLCFTFNALNSREIYTDEMTPDMMSVHRNPNVSHWSLENGYSDEVNATNYPIRVFNAKQGAALVVFLGLFIDDLEYVCRSLVPGFKIYLHAPGEVSLMSHKSFRLPLLEEAELSIKPTLVYTSDGLRSYTPDERNCFFGSERRLRFFKAYNRNSCQAECLANFTLLSCGCVKFSMPRSKSTKICGAANFDCYQAAERKLFGEDVIDGIKDNIAKTFRENCNCLQACTTIKYDAEIDRARLDWAATLGSYEHPFNMDKRMRPSVVTIFFRGHVVETYKRVEVYTFSNVLAICGGLLGLFLGVSALSIIEFIYYLTFRLYWTLRQWNSQNVVMPFKGGPANSVFIDMPNGL